MQAGAATRLSAVLHGAWMLAAVALVPWMLRTIPMAALAGILVVTGYRLISLVHLKHLFGRYGFLPAAIWAITLATVVTTDLLTGVLVGIGLSLIEILPWVRKLRLLVLIREVGTEWEVNLAGSATMLQFPYLAERLEALPAGRKITIRMRALWTIDHTCAEFITDWMARRQANGEIVYIETGAVIRHREMALALHGV